MRWSEDDDGSLVAESGDKEFVVRRVHIPYPSDAPPGLKLGTGLFWQLECFEDGRLVYGPPRLFDRLDDAKRAAGD